MSEIKINWIEDGARRYAVARWKFSGRLIFEIIDYSIYLSRRCALSNLTVETAIYHIVALLYFCKHNSCTISDLDDVRLRKFRDDEFARLTKRVEEHGSDKVQRRTVNVRLISVYNFLVWFQFYCLGSNSFIGPRGCNITSSLTALGETGRGRRFHKQRYPLLFSLSGASSKHRPIKAADNGIKSKLIESFSLSDDYIFARNSLIVEIADRMGMRRSSINSLTCRQFLRVLEESEAIIDLEVVPMSQKFGYQVSYLFPFQLVSSILSYMEGPRKSLLAKLKVPASATSDKLFLSSKTGMPLKNRTLSDFVASAMRNVGVPKGSIHSFRHKFINDEVEREIYNRVKLGLDTSIESVAASVALKVGHANPASLHSYISDAFSRLEKKLPIDNVSKIQQIEKEVENLQKQLEILRNAAKE